jgi:tRNA/tmRNA/rRNA uracil-C5-methylase (TrmA/RlmC/RlmD family)
MFSEPRTVTIEKLVQGGQGMAHLDSQVVFVRGVIPGETVSIVAGTQRKGFQEATIREMLVTSPDRVAPPCPVYEVCGGCQLQHIRYEAQLVQKGAILRETLSRVGRIGVDAILPVMTSPNPYGYRGTIRFVVFRAGKGFALGFHKEGTNEPVAASGCLLVPEATRKVAAAVEERLAGRPRLPMRIESLEIRRSVAFGSTLLVYRTGPAERGPAQHLFELFREVPDVVGQVVMAPNGKRWVEGQDWIADRLGELIFRISDRSFMQANWQLNERLAQTVTDWAGDTPGLRALELYAGIGTLGLTLARTGALVTLVEANPYALADARHAAKSNHIGRCRFRPLRAEAMLEAVRTGEYDVVLVDPPRTGLSRECLQSLLQVHVKRLLYLSCDPATLARDLGKLCGAGYRITRIQPFDMFPQTAHLETLVELVH